VGLRLAAGLVLSAVIGGLAYRGGAVSGSGFVGAIFLGTVFFGIGGWPWAALLVAFFASSSVLSHIGRRRKAALLGETAKGSRRDLGQALANAGVAAGLLILATAVGPEAPAYPILVLAFVGALATANADTWATEIGVLATHPPRLITTGRRVPPGTSGGVTLTGTAAALAGALFIGFVAALLGSGSLGALAWPPRLQDLPTGVWLVAASVAGLSGALFDSLLGATLQAGYYCETCDVPTEQVVHHQCGQPTEQVRGLHRLNNDRVNFLATALGAGIAALLA
jgi:uncharacterized protein (TIGR00297 family)